MVEVLRFSPSIGPQDVSSALSPAPARGSPFSPSRAMTREEHILKEMNLRKCGLRRGPPKRSQTISEYAVLSGPATLPPSAYSSSGVAPPRGAVPRTMPSPMQQQAQAQQAEQTQTKIEAPTPIAIPIRPGQQQKMPSRPALGSPRRSYSVMDYEPVPECEQPSSGLALTDLPTEIHYAIFDQLDPIDSTCLGLASRHFYAVHKRFHGGTAKIPLNARRSGPNDSEWAWRLAGQLANPATHPEHAKQALIGLAAFRVRGAVYCRKCGAAKCELHRHIKEWMGEGYEYCSVKDRFARPPTQPNARQACYRRKPNDPHQCGRHRQVNPPPPRAVTF